MLTPRTTDGTSNSLGLRGRAAVTEALASGTTARAPGTTARAPGTTALASGTTALASGITALASGITALALGIALTSAAGCTRAAGVARAYEPGTRVARREGVEVGLVGAVWDDRGVTLRLEVVALDEAVDLPMRNVVLVYEELAYPVGPVPGGPWPSPATGEAAVLRVEAGMAARVTGRVELGRSLTSPAVLRVHGRASPVGDADASRLELEIPPMPSTAPPPSGK